MLSRGSNHRPWQVGHTSSRILALRDPSNACSIVVDLQAGQFIPAPILPRAAAARADPGSLSDSTGSRRGRPAWRLCLAGRLLARAEVLVHAPGAVDLLQRLDEGIAVDGGGAVDTLVAAEVTAAREEIAVDHQA